jgi:hypothetical protein
MRDTGLLVVTKSSVPSFSHLLALVKAWSVFGRAGLQVGVDSLVSRSASSWFHFSAGATTENNSAKMRPDFSDSPQVHRALFEKCRKARSKALTSKAAAVQKVQGEMESER